MPSFNTSQILLISAILISIVILVILLSGALFWYERRRTQDLITKTVIKSGIQNIK